MFRQYIALNDHVLARVELINQLEAAAQKISQRIE